MIASSVFVCIRFDLARPYAQRPFPLTFYSYLRMTTIFTMSKNLIYFICTVCAILTFSISSVVCQNDTETLTGSPLSSTEIPTGSPLSSTETSTPGTLSSTETSKNITCQFHNGDCKACVANTDCYYCETDKRCRFKITKILTSDECDMKQIRYLTCRVNFQYLMIGIGVVAGIALLVIIIFCCYCCCKKKGVKISKSDLKWQRQREERKQIAAEKRQERAERTEEIRRKYGLVKDSNPYQKFDDA